jgi:hypothetical protein
LKHLITIVFFLSIPFFAPLTAQESIRFTEDITERTCPYDTSVTGFFTNQYEVYLTLDNTYEGTVDSNWCPVFTYDIAQNRYELQLEDFDFDRPIFVKLRYPTGGAPSLEPYRDYSVQTGHAYRNVLYRDPADCPGDCNQVQIAYTMADPEAGDTLQRRFELDAEYAEINGYGCFFSERYPQQRFDEIGRTIWLTRNGDNPRLIFDYGYNIYDSWGQNFRAEVDSIIFQADNLSGLQYRAFPSDVVVTEEPSDFFEGLYHLPQFADRRPGNDAIRYTEVNVEHDPDTVVSMRLVFGEGENIALPPFTGLCGAIVAGQDSIRHLLTIEFSNFYISNCSGFSVDLPIPPNTIYEFGADTITFGQDGACLVLEPNGGIAVRPGSSLQYGRNGQGLLAAKQESSITIAPNATLTFNNTLRLLHPISYPEGGMHVYLEEGSMLRFGDMANVERKHTTADVWVYVHGSKDQVDFGPLTPEEQALFRFINSPVILSPAPLLEVHAFPNPVLAGNQVSLFFPRAEVEGEKKYALYSAQGETLISDVLSVSNDSRSTINLPAHLAEGVYFLRVAGKERNYSVSVLVRAIR